MKRKLCRRLSLPLLLACGGPVMAQANADREKYVPIVKRALSKDYKKMFRALFRSSPNHAQDVIFGSQPEPSLSD
jgi:hypothetical protein